MNTPNTNEPPIINNPVSVELAEGYEDVGPCCGAQWIPVSQQGLYIKFLLLICGVFGIGSFGVYMLLEYLAR